MGCTVRLDPGEAFAVTELGVALLLAGLSHLLPAVLLILGAGVLALGFGLLAVSWQAAQQRRAAFRSPTDAYLRAEE
jgi:hypothetical protein